MTVPVTAPAGPQMWVRGPTVRRPGRSAAGSPGPAAHPDRDGTRQPYAGNPPYPQSGIAWVNAHGGAGSSTLAEVLGGTDVGNRWPDAAKGEPGRFLLVARTHAAGLQAASRTLDALRRQDHPKGLELVAVVAVADAPKHLPAQLSRRIRVLKSAARVYRVPWIPSWRLGVDPAKLPKEVRRLGDLVDAETEYAEAEYAESRYPETRYPDPGYPGSEYTEKPA